MAEVTRVLRQQFGRLLRLEDDQGQGVVIVLDQLGAENSYNHEIIAELPGPQVIKGLPLDELMEKVKEAYKGWGLI